VPWGGKGRREGNTNSDTQEKKKKKNTLPRKRENRCRLAEKKEKGECSRRQDFRKGRGLGGTARRPKKRGKRPEVWEKNKRKGKKKGQAARSCLGKEIATVSSMGKEKGKKDVF